MASRVCPSCRALNGATEQTCYRCGRRFPSPGTRWLASMGDQPLLVSRGLTLLCLVVFALMLATDQRIPIAPELGFGDRFRSSTMVRFGALFTAGGELEVFRLLSAVFVHFSVLHVGLNLWALLSFGARIEVQFGQARALLLFLLTGIAGFCVSYWWDDRIFTAGASGALFGQLGAYIGILIARKDPGWKEMLKQQLIYAAILALLMRVNTAAHIGGFVLGVGLGIAFERERRLPALSAVFSVLAVLGAVASVASIGLAFTSPLWKVVAAIEALRE